MMRVADADEAGAGEAGAEEAGAGQAGADQVPLPLVIRAGRLILDAGRLEADVGCGPVPLTRLEFLLLKELVTGVGAPVPKNALLAAVWGYDSGPGSNVVDVCVRRIRAKLGFELIKTVRGAGYQLVSR